MPKQKRFKAGDIVQSVGCKIFVTGEGDSKIGYEVFAGIVIENGTTQEADDWPLGMFSDTWTLSVFEKVKKVNGNKIIQGIFKKASEWDVLEKEIHGFYYDENGIELDDEKGGDLVDIGEAAARAFGYM